MAVIVYYLLKIILHQPTIAVRSFLLSWDHRSRRFSNLFYFALALLSLILSVVFLLQSLLLTSSPFQLTKTSFRYDILCIWSDKIFRKMLKMISFCSDCIHVLEPLFRRISIWLVVNIMVNSSCIE